MGYKIGNLGLGRQSGDHKAKAIEKYPDAGTFPLLCGLCSVVAVLAAQPEVADLVTRLLGRT